MKRKPQRKNKKQAFVEGFSLIGIIIILILMIRFLPVTIALFIFIWVDELIRTKMLLQKVKINWIDKGKNALFVYSNSPNWKDYIEENILPKISQKSHVLNWSERSQWDWNKKSLELRVFKNWAGVERYTVKEFKRKIRWSGEEYNPIAIIFEPWQKPKVLKFWKPFKDFKHGNEKSLKEMEDELFKCCSSCEERG